MRMVPTMASDTRANRKVLLGSVVQNQRRSRADKVMYVPFFHSSSLRGNSKNTRTVNELAHLPLTQRRYRSAGEPDFSCDWPSERARLRVDKSVCSESPA